MKRTIIMATLFLAGGLAQAAPERGTPASATSVQLAENETPTTASEDRTNRINQNTKARTDNRVRRRERAANAIGAPGLDKGIERRNERRENRRIELRTGQPPTDQSPPQQ
jgi:hypothetical protein